MNPLAHTHQGTPDDGQEWMTMIEMLDERDVDALLAGTAPAEELAPVAAVVTALREHAAAEPAPPMSAALRAQLYAPPVVSLHAHRAARFALVRAAVAAAVAALALIGVGAAQNRLPSGVQDVVSSTAELVGIDVPRSDERHATDDATDDGTSDEVPSAEGTDGTQVPGSTEQQDQGDPGHESTTPGGATPADPGTPGDKEPATPATPPSNPGNAGGSSSGNANNRNNGAGTNNSDNNASTTGQVNGTGTDKKAG